MSIYITDNIARLVHLWIEDEPDGIRADILGHQATTFRVTVAEAYGHVIAGPQGHDVAGAARSLDCRAIRVSRIALAITIHQIGFAGGEIS